MNPAHILVIEDDAIVARTIERSLRSDEFRISLASRGEQGLQMARLERPDLVILDIIMPDMDGYHVCRSMRSDPLLHTLPILFLTAKVKVQDKINGLTLGADDYLCKPFNVDELVLRVRAILRRTRRPQPAGSASASEPAAPAAPSVPAHCVMVEDYTLDTRSFELQTPQRGRIRLTPLQYDLLYHLMTHPGEAFTPARLLDEIWDFPTGKGSPDLVRVHIKTLRERIETTPSSPTFIRTLPGRGYIVGCEIS